MRIMLLINFIICNFYYINLAFARFDAIAGLLTVNGRDIIVKNETSISTLLDTFSLGSFQTYRCDDNNTKNMTTGGKIYGEFATIIDGIRVYKTNIAGIGYSFGIQTMCRGDMLFPSTGWQNNINNISICWFSHTWNQISHNFNVRIYKIGPTESGTVAKRQVGASILLYNNLSVWAEENPVFLNAFDVKTVGNNNQGGNNSNQGSNNSNQGGNNSNQGSNNNGNQGGNNSNQGNNNNGHQEGNDSNQGNNNNQWDNNSNQDNNNNRWDNNSNQDNNNSQLNNNSNQGNDHNHIWPNNGNNNSNNNNF